MLANTSANAIPDFASRPDCKGLAVVTGGSSGIGRGLAIKAAACGMTVVVLDLTDKQFPEVEDELREVGAPDVMMAQCDVSKVAEVYRVAKEALARFEHLPVSLICANAGYTGPGILGGEPKAIQRQIDVLTCGVMWTFKAFQEKFLNQVEPCALVATSSISGVLPANGSYGVGKHGSLAVMEALYAELKMKRAKHVKTHVLCPDLVRTNIASATESAQGLSNPLIKQVMEKLLSERGTPTSYIAEQLFNSIETGKFYIVLDHSDPEMSMGADENMSIRHRCIEQGAPPGRKMNKDTGIFVTVMNTMRQMHEAQAKTPMHSNL